jgi:hypothetical protein
MKRACKPFSPKNTIIASFTHLDFYNRMKYKSIYIFMGILTACFKPGVDSTAFQEILI